MNRRHLNHSGAVSISVEDYSLDNESRESRRHLVDSEQAGMPRQDAAVGFERSRPQVVSDPFSLRRDLAVQARTEVEALVLERTLELENAQRDMVARLALAGEYRDDGTGEHPRRVGRNAAAIARELGWREDEAAVLESAALLHDVGKIGIRDAVLLKPGKLELHEFEHMKSHTTIGARILSGGRSRLLHLAEEIALAHHERWDGEGYPLGLAGTEIPLAARIVAVADVLDALTHERPYKEAWPLSKALREIRDQSGAQFDPMVVRACLRVFDSESLEQPARQAARPERLATPERLTQSERLAQSERPNRTAASISDATYPAVASLVFGMPSLKQ